MKTTGQWLRRAATFSALVLTLLSNRAPAQDSDTTVSITATSRIAEEDSAPTMRPAVFRGAFTISRTGSTALAQPVYLVVSGTAQPGSWFAIGSAAGLPTK